MVICLHVIRHFVDISVEVNRYMVYGYSRQLPVLRNRPIEAGSLENACPILAEETPIAFQQKRGSLLMRVQSVKTKLTNVFAVASHAWKADSTTTAAKFVK